MTSADLETLGGPEQEPEPEQASDGSTKKITGRSPVRIAMDRLLRDKVAVVCACIAVFIFLVALLEPVITSLWNISTAPNHPGTNLDLSGFPLVGPPNHGFTWAHPLGLDTSLAADNLANLLHGLRIDLTVAVTATILSNLIGVVLGLLAGFSRGLLDRVITFFIDAFLSFPFLLGAISLAPIIISRFADKPDALQYAQGISLIAVLTFFGWMTLARLIRGYVITLREREFVQAAQVIGVPTRRILFKELLPNLVAPIVISLSITLPGLIEAQVGLSYLGIGVEGSLGSIIARAQGYYSTYPLYLFAPVVTVAVFVLVLNLLGDSVRDAFDPQTRR